jgi:hypothetical protein
VTKTSLIAVAITAAMAIPAYAKPKMKDDTFLMGAGMQSCGSFAETYRQSPTMAETLFFSWAQGFMSATNIYRIVAGNNAKNLNAISVEAQQARIRTYCDVHPLAD